MEAILGQLEAVMSHRATDRLHQITAPTLVITGDADRLIPPVNSDVIARSIPGARLVKIPGATDSTSRCRTRSTALSSTFWPLSRPEMVTW
jgi:pimeloyl-ACP methyl ester carboxylesterase